jgi:hypothetical protein
MTQKEIAIQQRITIRPSILGHNSFCEITLQRPPSHVKNHAGSLFPILEGAPTLKQKFARLRKETMTSSTLISLLSGAAGAFGA